MTGCKSLLCDFQTEIRPKVTFGDNSQGVTKGYGILQTGAVTFKRVAFVSGLKHNLISISQLCDVGFEVSFKKDLGTIFDQNGKVVLCAK